MRKSVLVVLGVLGLAGAGAVLAQEPPAPADQGSQAPRGRMGRDGPRGWDREGAGMMRMQGPQGRMDRGGPGRHMGGHQQALSDEEIDARLRERFARLDRNSDGVIDTAELEAAMASRGPMAGPGRERRQGQMGTRFIARFDQNADGKVTRDEYLVVVRERFRRADINNDGKITDDDLPPMARGQGLLSGRAAEAGPMMKRGRGQGRMLGWLRGADQNGDGQITLAEVETAALKRFDAVDRNHDGLVDATDFEALAKENVAYRVQRFLHLYGAERDGRVTREQFMKVGHERTAERRRMSANQNDSGRQGMRPRP